MHPTGRRARRVLVLLPLLAGCGATWPPENVAAFQRACLENARRTRPTAPEQSLRDYCDCTAERLQAQFTIEDFTAIEQRSLAEKKPAMEIVRVVEECAGLVR